MPPTPDRRHRQIARRAEADRRVLPGVHDRDRVAARSARSASAGLGRSTRLGGRPETAALISSALPCAVEPGSSSSSTPQVVQHPAHSPEGLRLEYVYLASPTRTPPVQPTRADRRQLAIEHPADADIVIPVPDSAPRRCYARQSGIQFAIGLVKNAYVGRTFIQPTQTIRQLGIRLKLNLPLRG